MLFLPADHLIIGLHKRISHKVLCNTKHSLMHGMRHDRHRTAYDKVEAPYSPTVALPRYPTSNKRLLCHHYRIVLRSLTRSTGSLTRYNTNSKTGCLLQRTRPFTWMPLGLALLLGHPQILHDSNKGEVLYPFLQCIQWLKSSFCRIIFTEATKIMFSFPYWPNCILEFQE